ncbi:hypothetical protein HY994_03150 [Candidatus Micrarchaeota archaeon]|nr:hypothetical protein [Candidatus Micrarchaeota archaeon]
MHRDGFSLTAVQSALLVLAICVSVYAHIGVFDAFLAPTYGNTGIHQANARELVETGQYPFQNDFSYGGGIPNLYVPIYRFALAQLVVMAGLDFDSGQRWMVMLFALALPLAFFAFGSSFGSSFGAWVGIAAAFLASFPSELLIYTIRPLPQGLGLVLLALAFALVLRKSRAAILAGVLLALVHQEAAVFFAVAVFAVGVVGKVYDYLGKTDTPMAMTALWAWAATTATYFAWNFLILGHFNVFELAQFKHHEGGPVSMTLLLDKTGYLLLVLAALGSVLALWGAFQLWTRKKPFGPEAFGLVVLGVGLVAVKNDVLGLSVFMDRFIVYWQFAFIFLAAFGLVFALQWIAGQKPDAEAMASSPAGCVQAAELA